jgi:hypothetical protein
VRNGSSKLHMPIFLATKKGKKRRRGMIEKKSKEGEER